jgi:hypothetical protein
MNSGVAPWKKSPDSITELQEKGFLVMVRRGSFAWKHGAKEGRASV